MMPPGPRVLLSSLPALALLGCTITSAPEPELGALAQAAKCKGLVCGNTSILGAFPFWTADETGVTPSPGGLRIKSLRHTQSGKPLTLEVDGFAAKGHGAIGSVGLEHTTMVIEQVGTSTTFTLSFALGASLPYYQGGDDGSTIQAYRVSYVETTGGRRRPPRDLCSPDGLSTIPRDVILFQGDRYDGATGEVLATGAAAAPWFNLACKDDALWKLALFRHVEPASAGAFTTTPDQRTAALRSIRADYCGDGTAYTQPGVTVSWTHPPGWLWPTVDQVVEALWDETGALCLDTPRLVERDQVDCAGALPACHELPATTAWTMATYVEQPL